MPHVPASRIDLGCSVARLEASAWNRTLSMTAGAWRTVLRMFLAYCSVLLHKRAFSACICGTIWLTFFHRHHVLLMAPILDRFP